MDEGTDEGRRAATPQVLMGTLAWFQAAYAIARAKATEELLRRRLLRRFRAHPGVSPRISEVMALETKDIGQDVSATDPRSMPSNPDFVASGWAEHMLLRYLIALEHCSRTRVLDTCCGLGWGSYLVASLSAHVTGVDLDEASVGFCSRRWGGENLDFRQANVLDLPFEDGSFDVVLSMDAVEHFSLDDGARYMAELSRVCRRGGRLFGSSAFPETRWGATRLCQTNPHHLYVYAREEMLELLRSSFGTPLLVTRHYFQALKL